MIIQDPKQWLDIGLVKNGNMKNIFIIITLLTLSSCAVSNKTLHDKCCKMEAQITELESKARGMEMKEQLLREAIYDIQIKNDTVK